jgi:hypothetical protein
VKIAGLLTSGYEKIRSNTDDKIDVNLLLSGMIQQLIIALVFAGALTYLGRLIWRAVQSKSCASGCGKCGALDVDAIEKQIRLKG